MQEGYQMKKVYPNFIKSNGVSVVLIILSPRIIGDGDLYKMLKDRYESQNIIFYGGLSNEETLNHIKGAKCIITATKMYEGKARLFK